MVVNFFIAGAAKCGSSSLYDIINQHPDVFMCPIKEVNHYNTDFHEILSTTEKKFEEMLMSATEQYLEGDDKTIMAGLVKDSSEYKKLYDKGSKKKILGEASIGYMHSKDALKNIFKTNKDAKFLFILRDPVKRFISHYWMIYRMGLTSKSLKEIIDFHKKSLDLSYHELILFESSKYSKYIPKYEKLFGSNHVLIIKSSCLKENFQKIMKKITVFLDIENYRFEPVVTNTGLYGSKYIFKFRRIVKYLLLCIPLEIRKSVIYLFKGFFERIFGLFVSKNVPITPSDVLLYLSELYNNDIGYVTKKTNNT